MRVLAIGAVVLAVVAAALFAGTTLAYVAWTWIAVGVFHAPVLNFWQVMVAWLVIGLIFSAARGVQTQAR